MTRVHDRMQAACRRIAGDTQGGCVDAFGGCGGVGWCADVYRSLREPEPEEAREDALRRCPFCGGEASVVPPSASYNWMVICGDCGASIEREGSEEDAVAAWNGRR